MGTAVRWLGAVLCLLPAAALGTLGVPHFIAGVARDAAIPVPAYMITQTAMPRSAYLGAAAALARAPAADGEARIARAEAALRAGAEPASQISELTNALMQSPASARGWILISEVWAPADKRKAARMLAQSLILAPHDYWLAGWQAQDAARLWPYLGTDAQARTLVQVRALWEDPLLRGQLRALLTSNAGVALATRAFRGRQDEVRRMNRWLSFQRIVDPLNQETSGSP